MSIEDGGKVGGDLILNLLGRRKDRPRGGRLNTLEARGAAKAALGGHVKGTRLLLLDQLSMSPQGHPCGRPRVQVLDLAAAYLHSGPVLGGQGSGEGRGEEPSRLASLGRKEGREGTAEGD